ncbi:MAG: hypothetical protein IPJ98_12820 [Bryobacterales bacterium]|nr:hypothetical protein [Bryobacterales bacterium]
MNTELLRIVEGVETRLTSVPTAEESRGVLAIQDAGGPRRLDLSSHQSHEPQPAEPVPAPNSVVTVRFSWNLNDQEYVINRFGGPFIPGFSLPNPEKTVNAGVGYTRTIGASMVNELRVGVNRYRNPLANGDPRSAEEFGIPNGSVANGIPSIEFRGGTLESLGGLAWFNRDQNETTYQVSDSLSVLVGGHSLKLGGTLLRQHMNTRGAYNQRGTVRFDGTRNTLVPRLAGNERAALLADFLPGLPSEAVITIGQFGRGFRQWNGSWFVQDSWRATARLTLNLGLRFDYTAPWTEVNREASNVTSQGRASDGGRGGVSRLVPCGRPYNLRAAAWLCLRCGRTGRLWCAADSAFSTRRCCRPLGGVGGEQQRRFRRRRSRVRPCRLRAVDLPHAAGFGALSCAVRSLRVRWADSGIRTRCSSKLGHPAQAGVELDAGDRLAAGARGVRLPVYRNGNQVPLESLTAAQRGLIGAAASAGQDTTALLQPLRPYLQFDNITLSENIASSVYHSGGAPYAAGPQRPAVRCLLHVRQSIDNASDFNSGDASASRC